MGRVALYRGKCVTYLIRRIRTQGLCVLFEDRVREDRVLETHFLNVRTQLGVAALH